MDKHEKLLDKVSSKTHVSKQDILALASDLQTKDLKQAMALDKKNIHKKLSFVLLKEIGASYVYPSDLSFIDEVEEV